MDYSGNAVEFAYIIRFNYSADEVMQLRQQASEMKQEDWDKRWDDEIDSWGDLDWDERSSSQGT